ncbi:globin [Rothia sp. CCM 9418]|uniref:globin n=1 Tax=unclassified Rothia (in: high G+C Gram-positive bacteria) TaxID=2689056 RepID=UPI003ACCD725
MSSHNHPAEQQSFYHQVGGAPTFEKLCSEFYQRVASDPEFRAMYPEEDLAPAERRLRMFLEQYWGGPTTYQQERGHPRLRMRHFPFAIGAKERDTWLQYMRESVKTLGLSPLHETVMLDYLERAAHAMQNRA